MKGIQFAMNRDTLDSLIDRLPGQEIGTAARLLRYLASNRLLEVVYDGNPEAVVSVDASVRNYRDVVAKERACLTFPAAEDEVPARSFSARAQSYTESPALPRSQNPLGRIL